MKRVFEFLYDLLEYWRVRRIECRAGVRFWQAGEACSGDGSCGTLLKAGDIALAKEIVSPTSGRRRA